MKLKRNLWKAFTAFLTAIIATFNSSRTIQASPGQSQELSSQQIYERIMRVRRVLRDNKLSKNSQMIGTNDPSYRKDLIYRPGCLIKYNFSVPCQKLPKKPESSNSPTEIESGEEERASDEEPIAPNPPWTNWNNWSDMSPPRSDWNDWSDWSDWSDWENAPSRWKNWNNWNNWKNSG